MAALLAATAWAALHYRRRSRELLGRLARLGERNDALTAANSVGEEYLRRFMWLSLGYIARMEEYRKSLNRVAAKRNFDELYDTIKATRHLDREVGDFYDCFDEAFLNIHPTFLADFNRLLRPDAQVSLKGSEKMNTELRLFALLKLGITDSDRLQEFLRCTASTVYNYRTNMRNRALRRDTFEQDVMAL